MGKYLDKIRQHEGTQPIETVKAEEALKQQKALDPISTIKPGDRVMWQGVDGKGRGPAMVDFVHTNHDGSRWAFCTLSDSWAAVNANFVTMAEKGDQRDGKTG